MFQSGIAKRELKEGREMATFDTMHFLGLLGMPRLIYTYQPDRGWNLLNLVVSIGGLIQGVAVRTALPAAIW
jgi:heme/copper-type cytochrome/quinol oxidase subunit 1